ncbi:hypothetical protein L6452_32244 [Arctium lappa]|uniref:Uncharacterized protein n=1 Tax=Arctium lappa TaxID=4217 RepID=A0ACB8Z370_ARCLA|nr:hypothetical protein L6452_32244 [Arctium lappa]
MVDRVLELFTCSPLLFNSIQLKSISFLSTSISNFFSKENQNTPLLRPHKFSFWWAGIRIWASIFRSKTRYPLAQFHNLCNCVR